MEAMGSLRDHQKFFPGSNLSRSQKTTFHDPEHKHIDCHLSIPLLIVVRVARYPRARGQVALSGVQFSQCHDLRDLFKLFSLGFSRI